MMVHERAMTLHGQPRRIPARHRRDAATGSVPADGDVLVALRYAVPLGVAFWTAVLVLALL